METYHQLQTVFEDTLLLFVTYLAQQHLSHPTIEVYLSAVRHNQFTTDKSWPTAAPRLHYVLKGIQRSYATTYQPRERLPITFPIMVGLHAVFSKTSGNFRDIMIWTACCLAYFDLLRVSEFTASSSDFLEQSKRRSIQERCTDIFGHAVCPVQELVQYLSRRGSTPGPLFLSSNSKWLTRQAFGKALDKALEELQMDSSQFNTHSFRIDATTSAKQVSMSDSHVKTLGRW